MEERELCPSKKTEQESCSKACAGFWLPTGSIPLIRFDDGGQSRSKLGWQAVSELEWIPCQGIPPLPPRGPDANDRPRRDRAAEAVKGRVHCIRCGPGCWYPGDRSPSGSHAQRSLIVQPASPVQGDSAHKQSSRVGWILLCLVHKVCRFTGGGELANHFWLIRESRPKANIRTFGQ